MFYGRIEGMNFFYFFIALLLSFACPLLHAEILPLVPYTAHYTIYLKGCPVGESVNKLTVSEGLYHFITDTQPYLNIVPYRYFAKSDFQFKAPWIIPQDYFYHTQEIRRNKKGQVHFNWKTRQLDNRYTQPNWEAPLLEGMQDKLSHSLQLRLDLLRGKSQPLEYTIAEENKILAYTFTVLFQEVLQTPIGTLNTLKIKHIDHKKQITFTWLAIDYDYLPVKMEHYRQGKKIGSGEIVSYVGALLNSPK